MHRKSKSKIKKQNIKLASDFISARKTLSSNSFINPINIGRYYYQTITNYESKKNKNMKIYNDKKEETKQFITSYNLIQKEKEKQNAEIKDQKLVSPFLDLINRYTQRGYKIPDLSTKKNIFSPSLILSDEAKTKEYFKVNKLSKKEKKELSYINKVNRCVIKRKHNIDKQAEKDKDDINENNEEEEKDQESTISIEKKTKTANNSDLFKLSQHCPSIKEEIGDLEKYNRSIEECIVNFETEKKTLFKKFIHSQIRGSLIPNTTKNKGFRLNNALFNKLGQKAISTRNSILESPTRGRSNSNTPNVLKTKTKPITFSLFRKKTDIIPTHVTTLSIRTAKTISEDLTNITLPNVSKQNEYNNELTVDPSELFKGIRRAKNKILSYNMEDMKKMILAKGKGRKSIKGREIIEKILSLNDTINNLDKEYIKAIEKRK